MEKSLCYTYIKNRTKTGKILHCGRYNMTNRSSLSRDFNTQEPTKNTEILLQEIKEATNIYSYLKKNTDLHLKPSLASYIQELLKEKAIKKSKLLHETGLSRSFLYAVLKNEKTPSRNSLIKLLFGMNASLSESYKLLNYAGYQPLYAKDLRDTILIFGLKQKMSLAKVNDILFDLNIEMIE